MASAGLSATISPAQYSAIRQNFLDALGRPLSMMVPQQAFAPDGNVVGFGIPQPWGDWTPGIDDRVFGLHLEMITHFELVASNAAVNLPPNISSDALPFIGVSGKLLGIPPGGWLVNHMHLCKTEFFVMIAGEMIAVGDFPGAVPQEVVVPSRSKDYYPTANGILVRVGSPAVAVHRGVYHAAYNPSKTRWAAFLEFATRNNDQTDNVFTDPRIARDK